MQTIDRETLKQTLDEGGDIAILNVLPKNAYGKEHIRGSENIPVDAADFEEKVERVVKSKDAPVVVYCASADCPKSGIAADKLEKAGFTHVQAYEGGIKDWKDAGYPVDGMG